MVCKNEIPENINDVKNIEGFDMLNKSKQEEIEAKFREQKKMKDLQIDDYNPWGKPGHGAPNEDTLRKRKIFMEVLPPVVLKPVGNDLTIMGRPGGGAPVRSKSGKLKNARVEDPQLRFQWNNAVRKMVDIDLRYRAPVAEQRAYKEDLGFKKCSLLRDCSGPDNWNRYIKYGLALLKSGVYICFGFLLYKMVKEKVCIEKEEKIKDDIEDRELGSEGGLFRRLGSHPQDNKDLYEKFPRLEEAIRIEELTGGIELEPLLAIRRRKAKRWPLHSTDVTGVLDIKPNISIGEKEYSEELAYEICEREHRKQEECEDEKLTARNHFEHWDTFWGRPGHGAPKPAKVRENLDFILYKLPILIQKESSSHSDETDPESEPAEN